MKRAVVQNELMSQFEFVSVAVSIVLALSITRLLTTLPHALARDRRYWVHGVWCFVMLSPHLGFWWSIWIYRGVESWSFQAFVAVLLTPALMYMTVTAQYVGNPSSDESRKWGQSIADYLRHARLNWSGPQNRIDVAVVTAQVYSSFCCHDGTNYLCYL